MRTKTNIKNGSVIHDLLTENRLWTFGIPNGLSIFTFNGMEKQSSKQLSIK